MGNDSSLSVMFESVSEVSSHGPEVNYLHQHVEVSLEVVEETLLIPKKIRWRRVNRQPPSNRRG